jgi:hypothetical protein
MRVLLAALMITLLAGCAEVVQGSPVQSTDAELIAGYFKALDDSATQGADAELAFLRRTQHPDYKSLLCDLGGITIEADPTLSTLRLDRNWVVTASGTRPRGEVYVVAISLRVRRDGQVLGEQIGSQRIVVLEGAVYGFMPCPR